MGLLYCGKIISSVGLGLDILGVIILFTLDFKLIGIGGHNLYLGGPAEAQVKKEKRRAWFGLGCLLFGFIMQFISIWIK